MAKREVTGDVIKFDLPSGTPVEIQEIDGSAEKALTNQKFLKTGRAMNALMLKALVSIDGKPLPENEGEANNLLLDMKSGDRNYLLLRIRMQSYGDEIIFNSECPKCHKTSGYKLNLQEMLDKGELKVYPYRDDTPVIVETRAGIAEVDYMTGRTEQWLSQQKEIDSVIMALAVCKMFNDHAPTYKEFEKMLVKDLNKIRLAFLDLKGGLDPRIELDCLECDNSYNVTLYQIPDFFIPQTTMETIGL